MIIEFYLYDKNILIHPHIYNDDNIKIYVVPWFLQVYAK